MKRVINSTLPGEEPLCHLGGEDVVKVVDRLSRNAADQVVKVVALHERYGIPEAVSQFQLLRLLVAGVPHRVVAGDEGVQSVGGGGEDHVDGRVHVWVVDILVAILVVEVTLTNRLV